MGITHQATHGQCACAIATPPCSAATRTRGGGTDADPRATPTCRLRLDGRDGSLARDAKKALGNPCGPSVIGCPAMDTRALDRGGPRPEPSTACSAWGHLWGQPRFEQARQALGASTPIFYLATKPNQGHFPRVARRTTLVLPVFKTASKHTTAPRLNRATFCALNETRQQPTSSARS